MSHKGNTETFYREIMAKVIEKVKEDFINEGINEDILVQLKKIWEDKLIQNGIFQPKPIPQMTYPKLTLYQKTNPFLKTEPKRTTNNSIKSSITNTTNENIQHYLEDKKNENQYLLQQQQLQQLQQAQLHQQQQQQQILTIPVIPPRFYTSTLQNTPKNDIQLQQQQQLGQMGQQQQQQQQGNIMSNSEQKMSNKDNREGNDEGNAKQSQMKEEVKEDEKFDEDSDVDVFIKKGDDNAKNPLENQNEEGDELLSPLSSDSNDLESDVKDFLLAQYEKVHRVRNKWKIHLKDAILHYSGKEFVFDRVVGELDRDW